MKQKQRIFRERNEIFPRAWERIMGLFDLLDLKRAKIRKRLIYKDQNQMNMEQILILLSREVIRWIEFPGRKQSKTPRRNGKF